VYLCVIHLILGCQNLHAGKLRSFFGKLNQQLFHLPGHGIVHLANGRQVHINRIPHQILQTKIESIRIFPIERIAAMFQIIPENGDYVYLVHHLLRHFRMVKQKLVQWDRFEVQRTFIGQIFTKRHGMQRIPIAFPAQRRLHLFTFD